MKYWVYMNGEVPGCYTPQELGGLTGFTMTTLVCPAEGEILEKNWRRSGEFTDIIKILHERDAAKAPSLPAAAMEPPAAADVNLLIDTASARLFSHVADLMKELENRREERALTQSVQRQLVDLKEQLTQARERSSVLETRLPRLLELEEAARKSDEKITGLETALRAREDGLAELRIQLEKARGDLDTSRRRLNESLNDLAIRNRLVDKLSRDLTEKEVSLAKALGVIRRLEEDLHRLMPGLPSVSDAGADEESRPAESVNPVVETARPAIEPLKPLVEPAKPAAAAEPAAPPALRPLFSIASAPAPALPSASPLPELPDLPALPSLAPQPAAAPAPLPAAPLPSAAPAAIVPLTPSEPPKEEALPAAPAYTTDEPTVPEPQPPLPPPPAAAAAQNAIVDLFKRFLSKDLHS